jgi:hypothetical protein
LIKQVKKILENVNPGDLIAVDWCDASSGKSSMSGGDIDVPVRSWGLFLGLIEGRIKHIVLAQNSFRFTESVFDLDFTAVPIGWAVEVKVLATKHVDREVAEDMMRSFAKNISHSRSNTAGLRSPRMFRYRMQRVCHENY